MSRRYIFCEPTIYHRCRGCGVLVSGCLVIRPERFAPELRTEIEQLLTDAEDVVSGVTARKQADTEQSEKEITVESAAAGFGSYDAA